MKRFVISIILVLMLTVPGMALAGTVLSDNDLDAVTAEAGVTITFNNISVSTSLDALSWGDTDGFSSYTSPGYAGLTNIQVSYYATNTTPYPLINVSNNMTLDVGSNASGVPILKISLPLIAIGGSYANISATLRTSTAANLGAGGTYATNINICDLSLHMTGNITISTH